MDGGFRETITALWGKLGLAPPRFTARSEVTLTVDGTNIRLTEADDGRHIVIAARAGRLSADPRVRADQVRRILKTNLALLQSNRALVALDPASSGEPIVLVRAVFAYADARTEPLADLVQDALALVEIHRPDLDRGAGARATSAARPAAAELDLQNAVVFRP